MKVQAILVVGAALAIAGCRSDNVQPSGSEGARDEAVEREDVAGRDKSVSATEGSASHVATKLRAINHVEIQAGEIAKKNATAKEVKDFGQMLIDDHKDLDAKVEGLKDAKVTQAPHQAAMSDTELKKAMDETTKLGALRGRDFDVKFLEHAVKDHDSAISFVKQSKSGASEELQALLDDTLEVMQKHHDKAKELLEKKKGDIQRTGGMEESGSQSGPQGGEREKPAPTPGEYQTGEGG